MNSKKLIAVLVLICSFCGIVLAQCPDFSTEKLTNGGDNGSIQISGNNAAWVGKDVNGVKQIFFYNGNSVTQLTNGITNNEKPEISGRKVVWQGQDPNNGDWEIFFYKDCIKQITDNNEDDTNPRISGSRIFWERHGDTDTDIMTAAVPVETAMKVTPRTINLKSNGRFIMAQLTMNNSAPIADVNFASLKLMGVEAIRIVAFERLNTMTVKFDRQEVQESLTTGDRVEITLTGKLSDGTVFTATDFVKVINPGQTLPPPVPGEG